MAQLYTHASFSLPCLALLAISWSLLFHDYLPATEALGWLGLVFLLLLGRWWHLRWRQPRLTELPLPVLERELFIGVTITSIIWALGVLLYMDRLPDTYRAAINRKSIQAGLDTLLETKQIEKAVPVSEIVLDRAPAP